MAEQDGTPIGARDPLRVLVVDNDLDVAEVAEAILTDEGYEVTIADGTDHASIAAAVGRVEPDCLLLDSADAPEFGGSWGVASYLANRPRAVPTVMFTAESAAVNEVRDGTSDRAAAAGFAAAVAKPFGLDELLDAVATATGRSVRFDRSEAGERQRTAELEEHLRDAGATDIRTSNRREWATFTSPIDQRIYQLYWWQRLGRYIVGRYDEGARLEMVGQFLERTAAVDAALAPEPH